MKLQASVKLKAEGLAGAAYDWTTKSIGGMARMLVDPSGHDGYMGRTVGFTCLSAVVGTHSCQPRRILRINMGAHDGERNSWSGRATRCGTRTCCSGCGAR